VKHALEDLIRDERHGPLPLLLLLLTILSGLVDAVSFLRLGHVFVANMTGNIVFLAFAVADVPEFSASAPSSLTALAAFMVGAFAAGHIGWHAGRHRARFLAIALSIKLALGTTAVVLALALPDSVADTLRLALIIVLAASMGIQNAAVRRLGVPDLTTTVLTLTLTGFLADSRLAGGSNPHPMRRLLAVLALFVGALAGTLVVFHAGIAAALAVGLALILTTAIAAYRLSFSSESWTAELR
jgi:uncharacterized membrane protein YoaK (UPF0700 family)